MRILIVGSGIYGSVCAHELGKAGHICHVIEKRSHIGGNIFTRFSEEAQCHEHVYGAHIFHTNSKFIWDYINKFSEFNNYVNRVKVKHDKSLYSFPINLFTFHQVFGVFSPSEAEIVLQKERLINKSPLNMEEYCQDLIGNTLYEIFIKGYTEKQWGKSPKDLPADVIKRIPFRLNFDDNYFNDRYQGIPVDGYTKIIERMLEGSRVDLNTDFNSDKDYYKNKYDYIIHTGQIDEYYDYEYGQLGYRGLRFERELINIRDFQGNAVINYTAANIPWTRIIEHKHFDMNLSSEKTLITKEFPADWKVGDVPFYPVNNPDNFELLEKYKSQKEKNIYFGGRLGEHKYYDMHQVVASALKFCKEFLK